jgi:hypothetical protein
VTMAIARLFIALKSYMQLTEGTIKLCLFG